MNRGSARTSIYVVATFALVGLNIVLSWSFALLYHIDLEGVHILKSVMLVLAVMSTPVLAGITLHSLFRYRTVVMRTLSVLLGSGACGICVIWLDLYIILNAIGS